MKRVIYGGVTKIIASVLFVASVVYGVLTFTAWSIKYSISEDGYVYAFENSFDDTRYFSGLLNAPEVALWDALTRAYYDGELENTDEIIARVEEELENPYYEDKIYYYVRYGDYELTNCSETVREHLTDYRFYSVVTRDGEGNVSRDYTSRNRNNGTYFMENLGHIYTETTPIEAWSIVKEIYVDRCENIWQSQKRDMREMLVDVGVCVLLALASFVYLICVCGRDKHGEQKRIWVDNVWTEVHLAAIAGCGVGAVALWIFLIEEYSYLSFSVDLLNIIVGVTATLASAVILGSTLSIVRNIKNRSFLASTLISRLLKLTFKAASVVIKWLFGTVRQIVVTLRSYIRVLITVISRKPGAILIALLLIYTMIIGIFGLFAYAANGFVFWAILIFIFAAFVVAYRAKDLDEIKKGAREVRGGNVSYKIPEVKSHDLRELAANVNDIAKGLDESVAAKVRAERLKSELITNVSHDLKTPITSIISYAQLLSQTEGLPEEARDFVQVIAKKGERLKTLTEDLFDISKVQSGNEEAVLEKLDAALLINQSLAEHEGEIENAALPFVVDTEHELYFAADGRKMSRVLSNLIGNILKYSLKGTRVFISARELDGLVVMEFKNIASYPMEFCAEDIVGRFVRGDAARSSEGNGLGLAIVKSYTELCGGVFEVVTDGDMFKAILKFEKYS